MLVQCCWIDVVGVSIHITQVPILHINVATNHGKCCSILSINAVQVHWNDKEGLCRGGGAGGRPIKAIVMASDGEELSRTSAAIKLIT